MAHGIKHGMSLLEPKICGKEFENEGAAWIATKWSFPTLSLKLRRQQVYFTSQLGIPCLSVKPNVALDWLVVIHRAILTTLW